MALNKDSNFKGLVINNAYIKVIRFEGSKNKLSFTIGYYASKDEQVIFTETYSVKEFDIEGDNAIKQAYETLKKMDKFSDAVDC